MMALASSMQDCYPGRENYEAKFRCDRCETIVYVSDTGSITDHRARKQLAKQHGWASEPDRFDTRKRPRQLDYCTDCR